MTEAEVTIDGEKYSIEVEDIGSITKMYLGARAPDELTEYAENSEEEIKQGDIDFELTEDIVDYMIDVITECTEFSENQADQLSMQAIVELGAEILNVVFEDSQDDGKRIKQVEVTQEFLAHLFTEKCAVVAGVPDDATLEKVAHDPSRDSIIATFSHPSWDRVAEGAKIPKISCYGVGIND